MKPKYLAVLLVTGLALAAAGGVFAVEASAEPTTVYVSASGGSDSNPCTQAAPCASITYALSVVATDGTVYLSGTFNPTNDPTDFPAGGRYGGIWIAQDVTIEAAPGAAATLDGGGTNWLFDVNGSDDVSFSGLTFEDGMATESTGGAITNEEGGTVTVSDSTFSGNTTVWDGGAIDNADTDGTGTLTVTDSTFSGNTADVDGGAIDNADNGSTGTLTVTDSTFSGNTADVDGGAIDNADNASDVGSGTMTISYSTFSGNTADLDGGAIDNGDNSSLSSIPVTGILTVGASTFSGDTAVTGDAIANAVDGGGGNVFIAANLIAEDCSANGEWRSSGHNAEIDNTCKSDSMLDDVKNADVATDLDSLADNGGPTQTSMPATGSAAIGLIPTSVTINIGASEGGGSGPDITIACPSTEDQRGTFANTTSGACDAGAVQTWATLSSTLTFTSTAPSDATAGGSTYTASATSNDSNEPVTFSAGSGTTNGACTVNSTTGVVTFVAAGTCDVAADEIADADTDYAAATEVDQSFTVTAPYVAPPSPPATTTTTSTTTTTTTPPTSTLSITTSQKTLTWCVGSGCSGYPNTTLVITSPTAQSFRVVLETKSHEHWKQVATSQLKAHAGKNSFRIAGRWRGKLVPAGQVQLLVQTKDGNGWKTRKTLKLTIAHKH